MAAAGNGFDRRHGRIVALGLKGKVEHHDGVFLDYAKQHDYAHKAVKIEFHAEKPEREQCAETRGRQAGKNGQRMDEAFVQNAQGQVNDHNGQEKQPAHTGQRILESLGRALEARDNGIRQDGRGNILDCGDGIGKRHARRQVE